MAWFRVLFANHEESLALYRSRFELGQTYSQIRPELTPDPISKQKHRFPTAPNQYHITQSLPVSFVLQSMLGQTVRLLRIALDSGAAFV